MEHRSCQCQALPACHIILIAVLMLLSFRLVDRDARDC